MPIVDSSNTAPTPLISVVVPTRHRNDALAVCLDRLAPSVQTVTVAYEVIVTDDGSTSTAEAMLRERYPWARWIPGPRRGPAANRNNAIGQAKGEWIAFVDDDCVPDPGWLKAYHDAITPGTQVYEGKTTCREGLTSLLDFAPVNETGGLLWSCNMMLHRNVLKQIGGFDESFPTAHLEDVDLRERLKAAGIAFVFTPAAVVNHPPKRAKIGDNLGRAAEGDVLFWYKQGHREPFGRKLLINNLRHRLHHLRTHRFSKDSLIWLWLTLKEVVYVSQHLGSWERKYSALYNSGKTS